MTNKIILEKPVGVIPYRIAPCVSTEQWWLVAIVARHVFLWIADYALIPRAMLFFSVTRVSRMHAPSPEARFLDFVKDKKGPSPDEELVFKTETRSFNHVSEYAIEEEVIWHRLLGEKKWEPLYFDGFAQNAIPCRIECDGANLMVFDRDRRVYYKKVIKEYFPDQIDPENNRHVNGNEGTFNPSEYLAVNKSSINNWKDRWFTLPYLQRIVNLVTDKRLTLPVYRDIAMSHRGRFNAYVEDAAGTRHRENGGNTTLFVLNETGRVIYLYDPWFPKWSKVKLYLPDTEHSFFEALRIRASASTVMVIGYTVERKTSKRTLKILTRRFDVDIARGHPGLKYSYFPDKKDPSIHVLPADFEWEEHRLPENADVTDLITIIQTGEGNVARELRVLGVEGYFRKRIDSDKWSWVSCKVQVERAVLKPIYYGKSEAQRTARSYRGKFKGSSYTLTLPSFGPATDHASPLLTLKNRVVKLDLYSGVSFWNYLGFSQKRYDLVIPREHHGDLELHRFFGTQNERQVNITINDSEVSLYTPWFTSPRFSVKVT